MDRVEWLLLAALAASSMVVIAALLTKGRPLSGADGLLAGDQLQYLTWIREAAHHGLIGNRYDLVPGTRAFLHPGFGLSGLVAAVTGISIPLAYLLWKPVAVLVMFFGARAYVHRFFPDANRRHVALLLVLFAVMPATAVVAFTGAGGKPTQYSFDFISGEMWSGQYLWGYLMTAIAVFLMPLVLLAYERWRTGGAVRWLVWAGLGALLCCWLQPWQGGTLALLVLAVEAWRWRRTGERPPLGALAVPAGVFVPALYYFLLSHLDPAWEIASKANGAGAQTTWHWPWWAIVLTVAPLVVPAALAWRPTDASWQQMAVRLWPFCALVVYLAPVGTFPYHAFQGLAIPLTILAVDGVTRRWPHPSRALVVGVLVLMVVPGYIHKLDVARNSVHVAGDPFFVFPDEVRALKWLEHDARPGGVLGPTYSGQMIPSRTGRETWVGALSWTPDWSARVKQADGLFEGRITGAAGLAVVQRSGARFVFRDCRPGLPDITPILQPVLAETHRFGCAIVWVVKDRSGLGPVGGPDA
jgi:hypothetical protein